jgi:hypothetical protein
MKSSRASSRVTIGMWSIVSENVFAFIIRVYIINPDDYPRRSHWKSFHCTYNYRVDQTWGNSILTGLATRILPARAGAWAGNILQTFRSRAELTFRASVFFQWILVQLAHPTCFGSLCVHAVSWHRSCHWKQRKDVISGRLGTRGTTHISCRDILLKK